MRLELKESIKKLKPKYNIFHNELLMRKSINREDRVRSPPDGCNLQERVVTTLHGISGKLTGEVVVVFCFLFFFLIFFLVCFCFFFTHPVTTGLCGIVLISTKRRSFKWQAGQ
jgi:ABC-type protease/lipase transport system fused ATPase/permease subunit